MELQRKINETHMPELFTYMGGKARGGNMKIEIKMSENVTDEDADELIKTISLTAQINGFDYIDSISLGDEISVDVDSVYMRMFEDLKVDLCDAAEDEELKDYIESKIDGVVLQIQGR